MRDASSRHSLKQRWLHILRAGAGSLVVAAAVVSAPAAQGAAPPTQSSIEERVEQARAGLVPGITGTEQEKAALDRLAFWGNRFGVVVRPAWPNWPNWHNWPNWGNYGGGPGPGGVWGNL